MPGPRTPRAFQVNPESESEESPFCFALVGPPGSGKTVSALRLAAGMARIRGGRPALIDTEGGRSRKYLKSRTPDGFDFDRLPFDPPFKPEFFMDAINEAAKLNPSAIIVDSASDEHEGPGGVLEWHDENVPKMGGNEWAAWNAPKASRRILTSGVQQIRIPIIMTFRARPKTTTKAGSKTPVKLGYMPIGGDELFGIMDLACVLPPKSNGVPIWQSALAGEDFTIKLPFFLAKFIREGDVMSEDLGEALARWQRGDLSGTAPAPNGKRTPEQMVDDYVAAVNSKPDLDALRTFQTNEKTAKFVESIRETRPDLHGRIVTANTRRAQELSSGGASLFDNDGGDNANDQASS